MVTVMRGGEEVKISKRAGSYVTVRDLVDEVGRDAVRYFFLMRKGDSQLVFDVDVARSQSEENPVYYIQMAHARMSGIFRVGEIDAGVGHRRRRGPLAPVAARGAGAHEGAARLSGASSPARRRRWSRIASPTICTTRPARRTSGTTRRTCSNEPEPLMRARLVLARAAQLVIAQRPLAARHLGAGADVNGIRRTFYQLT